MKQRFEPIKDKCGDIIESIMTSPDIPASDELQFKIRLSVEEAAENVVRYAYPDGQGWIEVSTSIEQPSNTLAIEIKDAGIKFDPLAKEDPDVEAALDERKIGGLGIFLCKQLMDDISYRYENGCNILTMKKNLN